MHLCMASSIRAMPEKEKPPAMRVDLYCILLRRDDCAKNLYLTKRYRKECSLLLPCIMLTFITNITQHKCSYRVRNWLGKSTLRAVFLIIKSLQIDNKEYIIKVRRYRFFKHHNRERFVFINFYTYKNNRVNLPREEHHE